MWETEFYETESGNKPVEEFLDSLDVKMRTKAVKDILLLKEFGTQMREPYSKPIREGIFELRIQFAGDISRIFYFFYTGKRIVLTNGFIKKTKKAPPAEIERALKYKADYERRF